MKIISNEIKIKLIRKESIKTIKQCNNQIDRANKRGPVLASQINDIADKWTDCNELKSKKDLRANHKKLMQEFEKVKNCISDTNERKKELEQEMLDEINQYPCTPVEWPFSGENKE